MSHLEKLRNFLECLRPLCDRGLIEDESILSELLEETDSLTSSVSSHKEEATDLIASYESVIAEFLRLPKRTISIGRSTLCETVFLDIQSLLISVLESTLNGRVSSTFWNSAKRDASKKLWLPTEIGSADSLLNSLTGSFVPTESSSWFSIQKWTHRPMRSSPTTFYPSFTYSIVDDKEGENTEKRNLRKRPKKKPPANRSLKLRLYPDATARSTLLKWFGCVRKTYNLALDRIRSKNHPIDRFWLRNRYVNACNVSKSQNWLLETPKHVREGAIDDLVDAYKVCFGKGDRFEMKFRRKKDVQSIVIPSSSIKSFDNGVLKIYPNMLPGKLEAEIPEGLKFDYDCRMMLDRLGRIYLCVPYRIQDRGGESQAAACAIDPGVRTFATVFGVRGTEIEVTKYGNNDVTRIYRLCKHLDSLVSKQSKKKNHRMKRAELRARERVRNLVKDAHCKVSKDLCSRYGEIILPPFEVSQMVLKGKRAIGSKTVRGMLGWSHYKFRERLKRVASERNCSIHILDEKHTTKSCTNCGFWNPKIKGEKTLTCKCCGVKVDRDVSGARNIFLKHTLLA